MRTQTDRADLGHAAHYLAKFYLNNKYWRDIREVAVRFNVDDEELTMLYFALRKALDEILRWGEVIHVEEQFKLEFDGVELSGSPDLVLRNVDTGQIIIVDWKSGYIQSDYHEQVYGYSILLKEKYKLQDEKIKTCIVWLREREMDVEEISPDTARLGDLKRLIHTTTEYKVAGHCTFCPRAHECPARAEELQGTANALIDTKGEVTTGKMLDMYDKAKLIENALKTYRKRLREMLELGPINHGGKEYSLKTVSTNTLKTAPTYSLLRDEINLPSMLRCMKFDKKALSELFGEFAPEKKKGEYIRGRMKKLEDANCFSTGSYKKISVKKTIKKGVSENE